LFFCVFPLLEICISVEYLFSKQTNAGILSLPRVSGDVSLRRETHIFHVEDAGRPSSKAGKEEGIMPKYTDSWP
jgi:hypothetical protein